MSKPKEDGYRRITIQAISVAMKPPVRRCSAHRLLLMALMLWPTGSAWGIVLHPDGEPNLPAWTHRPHADVVGRWASSASCTAVSSNCVMTTQHQKTRPDMLVEICRRLNIVPQHAVFVGDTDTDFKAGTAAGCKVIGFRAGSGECIKDLTELPVLVKRILSN